MAHESWPRCEACLGYGCAKCEGGRTRPEGWDDATQSVLPVEESKGRRSKKDELQAP
jgi:hypothetical protein